MAAPAPPARLSSTDPEHPDMAKARVAVLKTNPESVLTDVGRTMELAEVKRHLAPGATTILKDNISWHFPFPGANTTPWQLEGTIQSSRADGYTDQVCVQNKTVVTDAFKGEDLNRYVPGARQVRHPGALQLLRGRHEVGHLQAQGEDARAADDLPRGHPHPRLLPRQEHRPPADGEVPHLHDHHRRDEERVRRPAQHPPALHPLAGSTRRWSTCWRSRRRSTPGSSR